MSEHCSHCGQPMPELSNVAQMELGPFQAHSETSRLAALRAYPRQSSQRERILLAVADRPSTRDELVTRLRLGGNSIRPRVKELLEGQWLYVTDQTRPSNTGSPAEVLDLTDRARAELAGRVAA